MKNYSFWIMIGIWVIIAVVSKDEPISDAMIVGTICSQVWMVGLYLNARR